MNSQNYVDKLNSRYKSGITTEHSFRGDFQNLIESLFPEVMITNEPQRIACGAPDYIITKKNIPIGYIEAKDLNSDLNSKGYLEQFNRYKQSLENLIITNYIDFQFFRNGELVIEISIASIVGGRLVGDKDKYKQFEELLKDFVSFVGQTIKSSQKLAVFMANKARLLSNVIEVALISDVNNQANSTLKDQMKAFQEILIHDIDSEGFADIYAQTIAYGMFAARLHDPSLDTFTRQEASELIPKSNPFLRKLFSYIAGPDIDDRIKWIVDALADIFRATDIAEMLKSFGKKTEQTDPVIHFYETFLSEYDPKLRKSRGVWYTPEPVVKFIVRAVDDILKTEFNLAEGLADISKTKIKVEIQGKKVAQEVHKVQILDPATGTGTFLAEVVKYIYSNKFVGQQGIWSNYIENHLLPRLNGFELLMASYAMAHLKLDLLLTETGFKPTKEQRLRVYLTNSLEEHHADTGTLFANWLSIEANEANYIKRDTPVMCIVGNPPYNVNSVNKGEWIEKLVADFKTGLNEKNIQPLSDDYIKFIRFGQYFIDKNGSGILAYISNNTFIDGIIHRQMRLHLLKSFNKIFVLDLHGNSKKKEKSPDGSVDENVFDIMQGVSINIFVKTNVNVKRPLGEVYYFSLLGKREKKYDFLNDKKIRDIEWVKIDSDLSNSSFVQRDRELEKNYNLGFGLSDLFVQNSSGIETRKDYLVTSFDESRLKSIIFDFKHLNEAEIMNKYLVNNESRDWKIDAAKQDIISNHPKILDIFQKPFDKRKIIYTGKTKGIVGYPMYNNFKHLLKKDNIGLISKRGRLLGSNGDFSHIFICNGLVDKNFLADLSYVFPLYLYSDENKHEVLIQSDGRSSNLNAKIIQRIADLLKLKFTIEKELKHDTFAPIDILDYIYAVLHSNTYRLKYKDFLKNDFPKIPFPNNIESFWKLVKSGGIIRQLHLMVSPILDKFITQYPINGNNEVDKIKYKDGNVFINEKQYFSNIPEIAWNFSIGGYQPAQKWLKDRKGRELTFDDIRHYQRIIVSLMETDREMKQIDEVLVL